MTGRVLRRRLRSQRERQWGVMSQLTEGEPAKACQDPGEDDEDWPGGAGHPVRCVLEALEAAYHQGRGATGRHRGMVVHAALLSSRDA